MGAEVAALCGAAHGERHPERTNRRNGYRERIWGTPALIDIEAIPERHDAVENRLAAAGGRSGWLEALTTGVVFGYASIDTKSCVYGGSDEHQVISDAAIPRVPRGLHA